MYNGAALNTNKCILPVYNVMLSVSRRRQKPVYRTNADEGYCSIQ